ncbi:MAG: hypothetical protein ACJ78Q_13215 [Chloroflexia bacterium]
MLERTTRLFSENLARAIDRRSFLKRVGETTFAGVAALAAGHLVPAMAAAGGGNIVPKTPQCAPPGPYCNITGVSEPNGCHGANCFQHMVGGQVYQCRVYYSFYQAGCWTTSVTGGYWTCCDCRCTDAAQTTCGCAQFNGSPAPRPDLPTGGSAA